MSRDDHDADRSQSARPPGHNGESAASSRSDHPADEVECRKEEDRIIRRIVATAVLTVVPALLCVAVYLLDTIFHVPLEWLLKCLLPIAVVCLFGLVFLAVSWKGGRPHPNGC